MFDVERPVIVFQAGVVDTNKCRRDSIIGCLADPTGWSGKPDLAAVLS